MPGGARYPGEAGSIPVRRPAGLLAQLKGMHMKTFLILVTCLAVGILARVADAAESAPKPQTCLNFAIAKTDATHDDAVAICYDGKKPALFYRFEVVEVPGKDSGRVKVLVGWR